MGIVLATKNEYEQAGRYLRLSKHTREELPDFVEFQNWSPVYHLGVIAWVEGHYEEADRLLMRALKVREEVLGKDDTQSSR